MHLDDLGPLSPLLGTRSNELIFWRYFRRQIRSTILSSRHVSGNISRRMEETRTIWGIRCDVMFWGAFWLLDRLKMHLEK